MKRKISVLLSLIMAVSLLSACGSKEADTDLENPVEETPVVEEAEDPEEKTKELVYPWGLTKAPMNAGGTYEYKSIASKDTSVELTGYVYISEYTVTDTDDPGYVDKTARARFVFDSDEARNYGTKYYTLNNDINATVYNSDGDWIVDMDGEKYELYVQEDGFTREEWLNNGIYIVDYVFSIRVPRGYDDVFLVFYNPVNVMDYEDEDGNTKGDTPLTEIIDEDSLWFVMGDIEDDDSWYFNEDTKFTPSYYGGFYETQKSDGDVSGILGAEYVRMVPPEVKIEDDIKTPVEEPDKEKESASAGEYDPNLNLETDGEVIVGEEEFGDSTVILLDDWSVDTISRKNPGQVKFATTVYNWVEGDHIVVNVYTESSGHNYAHFDYELTNDENNFTFDFTGENIVGNELYFDFMVVGSDGFEYTLSQAIILVE